jgi:hypothetical protein
MPGEHYVSAGALYLALERSGLGAGSTAGAARLPRTTATTVKPLTKKGNQTCDSQGTGIKNRTSSLRSDVWPADGGPETRVVAEIPDGKFPEEQGPTLAQPTSREQGDAQHSMKPKATAKVAAKSKRDQGNRSPLRLQPSQASIGIRVRRLTHQG